MNRAAAVLLVLLVTTTGLVLVTGPAGAVPAVTVSPDRPLVDGERITLLGSGFTGGRLAGAAQCTPEVLASASVFEHCDTSGVNVGVVGPTGRIRLQLVARRFIQIRGATVDCAEAGACVTGISSISGLADSTELTAVPMVFRPDVANDAPLELDVELDGWTSRRVDVTVRCSRPANLTIDTSLVQDHRRPRAVVKGDHRTRCEDSLSTAVLLVPHDVRHGSTNRITRLLPGPAELRLTVRGNAGRWSDRVDTRRPVDVTMARLAERDSQPHGGVTIDMAGLQVSAEGRAVASVQAACTGGTSTVSIHVTALTDAPGGAHRRMLGEQPHTDCTGTQTFRIPVEQGSLTSNREDILPAGRTELYARAHIVPPSGRAGPAVAIRPVRTQRAITPASLRGIVHRAESRLRIGPATTSGVRGSMRCGRTVPFTVFGSVAQPVGTVVHTADGRSVIRCVEGHTIGFSVPWNRTIRSGVRSAVMLRAVNGDVYDMPDEWQQTQAGWRTTR